MHDATSTSRSSKKFLRATPTLSFDTSSSSTDAYFDSPTRTSNNTAASRTVLVIGPTVSNDVDSGTTPFVLISSALGRWPTIPHSAGGQRIEPDVSLPSAAKQSPAATAAADPDDDPPAMRSRFQGFRT